MKRRSVYRGHALRITIGIAILVLLVAGGAGAVTEISDCGTISSPGEYVLTKDITDSLASSCINIASNDVIFDGAGHTIDGIDTSWSNGVYIYNAVVSLTGVTVKNLKLTDWYYGIYARNAVNGNIINNNFSSNILGIELFVSRSYILTDNNASSNGMGIELLYSNDNSLTNNIASWNSYYGIYLVAANNNLLRDNSASSNTNTGIFLSSSGGNTIYNNRFNNINNFGFAGSLSNAWSTTKTAGTNIVGGPYLGGNFWANPSGTGFSQTCTDADGDGICDSTYTLATGNVDNLPLSFAAPLPVQIDIKPGSFPNSINLGTGGTVPVAILSTTTFDATTVDPITVTLASAPVKLKGQGTPMASFQDVNGDGLMDLVVHVSTEALLLSETDTEAILTGQTFDGTRIQGTDSVRIVP